MTSDKKNISLLTELFLQHGLENIVISPGSRNAPIVISFANNKNVNTFTIVDERSAAFFALGMALQTGKTVAIACTSGSAVLNYASAISEAYYQKIPLLILTADRPQHLIDIGDGQTIRQSGVFNNYIKKSYNLPLEISTEEELIKTEAIINEALNSCRLPESGPVHINIPFDEPLYQTTNETNIAKADIKFPDTNISTNDINLLSKEISSSRKVMIIAGQLNSDNKLNEQLCNISDFDNIIVLSETTSNLHGQGFIDTIDNLVSGFSEEDKLIFSPDILISLGGQVVSKMMKKFLRTNKPKKHYHISPSGEKMDTYFSLTKSIISSNLGDFFSSLVNEISSYKSDYSSLWKNRKTKTEARKNNYLENAEYSDLKVFESIINKLPENICLHLGNSTPVRYSQLFGSKNGIIYNSNRGVSGIDGQLSTAAGYSYYSNKTNVLITGDLGFFYDSNGLMNSYLKSNFKIIVINNSGGGIFRFIPGPDTTPNLEQVFAYHHNYKSEYICKAFNVEYLKAENLFDLEKNLKVLFNNDKTTVLEVFTPEEINGRVLRDYFGYLKH
ncbi:MAG: 2-succinyl-5-enolpyruvyl-6-hydroxy-3-cyclohexene-1-carboxylic-acid synthase [Marinilabiliales bacterium]|nr:MAG: 2-succinyl-5-enolpyruvyl-6-hydroxy-3-cyclohexene-1-carboxylic-acid synthase [Marinilabiliales bacterium]